MFFEEKKLVTQQIQMKILMWVISILYYWTNYETVFNLKYEMSQKNKSALFKAHVSIISLFKPQ